MVTKRGSLRSLALLCLLGACAAAPAQEQYDPEVSEAHHAFNIAVRKEDFAGAEQQHAALAAARRRSQLGAFVEDGQVMFYDLANCEHVMTGQPGVPDATPGSTLETRRASCYAGLDKRFKAWAGKYPASSLPAVALADLYMSQALGLRLRGVPASGAEQEALAERAWQALARVPAKSREAVWYARAMRVATAQGWGAKRFGALLAEASSRHGTHAAIYRQAALYYLPRNGGSAKDLEELAQLAVSRSIGSEGMSMYAHVYDEIALGEGGMWQNAYARTALQWGALRAGLQDIYKRYPAPWNLNRLAQHACLANDMATLQPLLAKIGAPRTSQPLDGWMPGELDRCRELAARTPAKTS